ncbi:MAG: methyltransferase domain-containing protein [Methylovulum miyakonense]|uniref:class I SAM-dependent methyltransferase n=1 Tax=Methylovulum miyakonense TaxID=645578 RepID=UPI003BB6A057
MDSLPLYQCIVCANELTVTPVGQWACPHCGRYYPSIEGIGVFIPGAAVSIQGYVQEMAEAKAGLAQMADNLRAFQAQFPESELSERIGTTLKGIGKNSGVLERPYQPIIEFLQDHPVQADLLAWSMIKTGTTFHDMLPYFYQDWSGTPDFEKVAAQLGKTVHDHCDDRQAVAVLGAGACGLLHSVAKHFVVAYGVDLSLPTLLAAKTLMAGEALEFHLPEANWRQVTLTQPEQEAGNIHFLTANVNNLPFKDASLSVVVTQYMLDIVSNPLGLAKEIRRILKPEGKWINFSKPFRVATDSPELGMRNLAELPPLFNTLGFDVIELENQRFIYLNMEKAYPEADSIHQLVHYFVLRKNNPHPDGANIKDVSRFFEPNGSVWQEIPRLVQGRALTFTTGKSFDGKGGVNECLQISVMGHIFSIPADFSRLLETVFAAVDGQRDLREIFQIQRPIFGLDEQPFLKLMYILSVLHYLLEFHR